ncbi:MAG: hypothetical protein KDJ29_14380 [Hyphomicrobiales bacterium]|nr:hypothetical protein [Hyphomicrobiales bacterium]
MPNRNLDQTRQHGDPEEMIAFMRDHPFSAAMEYVETLPDTAKARIAVFFYQRRHLRNAGLEIAKICSRGALNEAAGAAGETIYQQSRNPDATMRAGQFTEERAVRQKKISLAGGRGLP